jgi:hypothetical protein
VADFRITFTPNRRAGFHDRWFPLLSDVAADRAVVAASTVFGHPDLYRFDVVLFRLVPGTFGRSDAWATVGTAAGVLVEGRAAATQARHGDHVTLLCSSAPPVWECRGCGRRYGDLPKAADCAALCWGAKLEDLRASARRFYEANRGAWWAHSLASPQRLQE